MPKKLIATEPLGLNRQDMRNLAVGTDADWILIPEFKCVPGTRVVEFLCLNHKRKSRRVQMVRLAYQTVGPCGRSIHYFFAGRCPDPDCPRVYWFPHRITNRMDRYEELLKRGKELDYTNGFVR